MELDSLKDIWKNLDEDDLRPGSRELPIESMVQKRSQGSIARLKRNLNREALAVVIIYSITIWYIIAYQQLYRELAVLLLLIGGGFMFYYYRKSKLLQQMECVDSEVKSNLKRQLSTLEKYVRFYFVAGNILTPLAYFAAGMIILFNTPDAPDNNHISIDVALSNLPRAEHLTDNRFFYLFIGTGVALTASIYFVNRWWINKLYGQHIQKLKELLGQMDETA
jgi:Ca2+/Na+ antiporter